MLSSLKGVRMFYSKTQGPGKLWLFDALTVAGFGLRWCAFLIGAGFSGKTPLNAKAASSRQYLTIALQLMKTKLE
jgi:N-acetylglucosaminyl-diphospho-decaprenol L-rhamnosyltransferase